MDLAKFAEVGGAWSALGYYRRSMRILIHSKEGDSGGLAYKMQSEGSEVNLFIQEKWARPQMEGLVPHVENLEEGLRAKPEYILFDQNGSGTTADKLRKSGNKVIGGSALADRMEFDRAWGVKLCEQYGIRTPRTTPFKTVEEAIKFVLETKKPYAVKMDSNAGGESASFVAKTSEELVEYLNQQKESGKIKGATFILQEVVKGAEISTELWFSNGDPLWPANSTLEDKKFLAGGLGQRTGCEVSLVCHYEGHQSKILDRTIRKLFPLLKYSKWTGPLDVNCIISEVDHEPYFLEFTPRIGYSAIYAYAAILGLPISEYFGNLARGTFIIPFKAKWGSALKVSIPPYPTQIVPDSAAKETYGLQQGVRLGGTLGTDFIPIDVQKGQNKGLECAGVTCILGEGLGRGNAVLEAWRGSQRAFSAINVPNKQGRYVDGLEDIWKRCVKLKQFGYDLPEFRGAGPLASKAPATVYA